MAVIKDESILLPYMRAVGRYVMKFHCFGECIPLTYENRPFNFGRQELEQTCFQAAVLSRASVYIEEAARWTNPMEKVEGVPLPNLRVTLAADDSSKQIWAVGSDDHRASGMKSIVVNFGNIDQFGEHPCAGTFTTASLA